MRTIKDLPEEVLQYIFEKLEQYDLKACQKVCRSWYHASHPKLLEEITIRNKITTEAFIRSIDCNPDPLYLNSVKKLYLDGDYATGYHFDKEIIRKLIVRFSNLRHITVRNFTSLFEEFDQELCSEILQGCPKIESFIVIDFGHKNLDLLWKLRHLITEFNVEWITSPISRFGNMVNFVTSFCRLRGIEGFCDQINSFQVYLEIFEHLDSLTSISLKETVALGQNSAERYLAEKPGNVQALVVERLSKVKQLKWLPFPFLSLGSLEFTGTYFTGLKNLTVNCKFDNNLTASQKDIFWRNIVKLFAIPTTYAYIHLKAIELEYLGKHLVQIIHKAFHQASPAFTKTTKRTLELNMENVEDDMGNLTLMNLHGSKPTITLDIINENSLGYYILVELFKNGPLEGVDAVILNIKRDYSSQDIRESYTTSVFFEQILAAVPSAKEVTFDIPDWYLDHDTSQTIEYQPDVLTLRPARNAKFQNLLDQYAIVLPNLKRLNLYYFSGLWEQYLGEYRVSLGKYSLEFLSLDVSPIQMKTWETNNWSESWEDNFFVVELEILSSSKRYLYKVSFDLQRIITLKYEDLHGYSLGEDYFRVHVMVRSLQTLEIWIYTQAEEDEENLYFPHWENCKSVILFK